MISPVAVAFISGFGFGGLATFLLLLTVFKK